MTYAIIGFRSIGQALAKSFARHGIHVSVATTRDPKSFASEASSIGPTIQAKTLDEAIKADIIFLAVRFESYADVSRALPIWQGKIIVDVTNAYGASVSVLKDDKPSSKVIEEAFQGAKVVKGFNHLPAAALAKDPTIMGKGKRVIFLAGDHQDAVEEVSKLTEDLGFAPVYLGDLSEGGQLVGTKGKTWGRLIFKDLIKLD